MVTIEKLGIILSPTERDFENYGVFNPGVYQEGNTVHLFYRAEQYGNICTIGYAKTEGPTKVVERYDHPILTPNVDVDVKGIKDAKIVKIDDIFYLTYSAYNGMNTIGALATSKDMLHFEKQGPITPDMNYVDYERLILKCGKRLNPKYHYYFKIFNEIGINDEHLRKIRVKDLVLFPRKINGKFAMLISLYPGIQIVYFDNFSDLTKEFWDDYLENLLDYIVLDPKFDFEVNHIGTGCVPIETENGWLLIYHSVEEVVTGNVYHACAALLQLDKPEIEIARLPYPLFSPTKLWENDGIPVVYVFPSGCATFDKDLYIYYGAAKRHIAVVKIHNNDLVEELLKQP